MKTIEYYQVVKPFDVNNNKVEGIIRCEVDESKDWIRIDNNELSLSSVTDKLHNITVQYLTEALKFVLQNYLLEKRKTMKTIEYYQVVKPFDVGNKKLEGIIRCEVDESKDWIKIENNELNLSSVTDKLHNITVQYLTEALQNI